VRDPSSRIRKLRWLCRRGMKELDVLLERFLEANNTLLDEGGFPEMESMLQVEDDILWDWLQQPDLPAAEPYRKLLKRILHG
jgi:antitoxin CptB